MFLSGKYQLKPEFQKLEKPATEMPRFSNPETEELIEHLRQIFKPKRNPGDESPTKDLASHMTTSVAVQIQQLAAPLVDQGFRVVPVNVEDQVRYLVTDISDQNYIVQLNPELGTCNCPSKFFCHHLLAVRFRAGVQADLKIPSKAKLPKPADMDKREKGRRQVHGTKRPIAADDVHAGVNKKKRANTGATKSTKQSKKLKLIKEDPEKEEEEVEEEEEEDSFRLYLSDSEDPLFITLPDKPFAKKSAPPPVAEDIPAPVVASLPPPAKVPSLPSHDVSLGFLAAVRDQGLPEELELS